MRSLQDGVEFNLKSVIATDGHKFLVALRAA